jgi:hypothetical protein
MAKAVDVAITLQKVTVYPKIARPTACKLAQEGRAPGQKVGRQWRFGRDGQ